MEQHGQDTVKFDDIKVKQGKIREGWKEGGGGRDRRERSYDLLMILVIQDEIYDMVKPADPLHITLQDLITRYSNGTYTHTYVGTSLSLAVWPTSQLHSLRDVWHKERATKPKFVLRPNHLSNPICTVGIHQVCWSSGCMTDDLTFESQCCSIFALL